MLFADLLVEMTQGKVGINLPLELAQHGDGGCRDALAPRPPAALIHHRRHPAVLDRSANPEHLSRRDPDDIRRRYPTQLSTDGLDDYFAPGHCSRLPPHLPLDVLHRAPLPQ
jgi:hypothetical protein